MDPLIGKMCWNVRFGLIVFQRIHCLGYGSSYLVNNVSHTHFEHSPTSSLQTTRIRISQVENIPCQPWTDAPKIASKNTDGLAVQ